MLVNGKQVENPKAYDPAYNNPNAYGIVVKKYQQNANGRFVAAEGQFQDTEEDFKLFVSLNEDMFQRLSKSKNVKTVFPTQMGLGKAALPKRFAKWLQDQLLERFGINSTIKENQRSDYDGYGLELTSVSNPIKKEDDSSDEPLVTDNFDDDPFLPTDTNFNDSPIDIVDDGSKEFADVDMSNVSFSDDSYIIVNGGELYGEAADSFLKEAADAADKEEEKKAKSLEEYSKEHNNWC